MESGSKKEKRLRRSAKEAQGLAFQTNVVGKWQVREALGGRACSTYKISESRNAMSRHDWTRLELAFSHLRRHLGQLMGELRRRT